MFVVYFFDVLEDPNRKELNKIAKSYGGTFVLAEINKWPDQNKDELFFATQELKRKYMPGAGMAPVLVFFHEGQQVNFLKDFIYGAFQVGIWISSISF